TNLVAVCKGYMEFERDTFERIAQARSQYDRAVTVSQKAQADQSMTQATRGLLAVAENYPELKASNNFLQLQGRITELESQIADRREFYNDSVNTYNVRIQQAPDMIVAGWMHLQPRQMFKVEEADKANVPMVFSTGAH
ncbi:MAG TPA: LemA family protein, partial [Terriglobales bacterium]|nr:LemA family protein [Terriglobales bacterium]